MKNHGAVVNYGNVAGNSSLDSRGTRFGGNAGIGSGAEVLTRGIASGAEVLTAVVWQRISGFDFAGGRVVTALLQFLLSGEQHPTSGVGARESAYDTGIIVRHVLWDGEGEAI